MHVFPVLAVVAVAVCAAQVSYENYKVYRVRPSGTHQLKTLAAYVKNDCYDFLAPLRRNEDPVDVLVSPPAQEVFANGLENHGIKYEVLIENAESVIQEERENPTIDLRIDQESISFTKFNRYDEINAYIERLAKYYPDTVSLQTIGKTYEGRDLKVVQISTNSSAKKPVIFIDAGIHAREWIAPAQAIYIVNQLVENPNNTNLIDKVDWHILPVVNPDGYEYTHEIDRYWRKTRSPGDKCNGTDANRNFDFHWGEGKVNRDECSGTYIGKTAFSERETIALGDYLIKFKNNIKLYLTLHSYGKYLLFPWGFTSALPDDYDELQNLGEQVADAIYRVNGTIYKIGTSTNVLYEAAGGSDDWAKAVAGIELSYTVELPGNGVGWAGFDPPTSQILPIVAETWEGIKAYHRYIESKFGQNNA